MNATIENRIKLAAAIGWHSFSEAPEVPGTTNTAYWFGTRPDGLIEEIPNPWTDDSAAWQLFDGVRSKPNITLHSSQIGNQHHIRIMEMLKYRSHEYFGKGTSNKEALCNSVLWWLENRIPE